MTDENVDSENHEKADNRNEVRLTPPWADGPRFVNVSTFAFPDRDMMRNFVDRRTMAHELYIKEEAKTKRLTLVISAVFLLAAIAVILFAPDGREIRSLFISGILLVFAAGTFGYKRVYGKTKGIYFGADNYFGGDNDIGTRANKAIDSDEE